MDKYKNKYRIQSHRMPKWDYSGNGLYFITLVTQNRECNLGEIHKGEMALSAFGRIVDNEWLKSFEIRRELFLDEYSIMPNHLHAIVVGQNPIPIPINITTGVTIRTKPRPTTNIVPKTPIYFIVYRRFQIVGQF